jgi:hypothetical protein
MEITEAQKKILEAVKEARKMLQKEDSISGDGVATGDNTVNPIGNISNDGDTLETAQSETKPFNVDQLGLGRKKVKNLQEKTPIKAVVPIKAGEEPPEGYLQPKKGVKLAVNPDAITNPSKFISAKHKEEQK